MTDSLDVTVIVVNLNGKAHLETFMASLAVQTFPRERFEVLLVDNGSQDDSVPWLRAHHPEVTILQNATNEGFAKPNNDAAKVARGRYLALLNNDMKLEADWLERMVAARQASPADMACIGSRIMNWDGTRVDFIGGGMGFNAMGFQLGFQKPASEVQAADYPTEMLFACGGAMLIDRDVFLEVGGFDEDYFAYFEDVDLGWRLWVLGYRVGFCPEAVTCHRHNGTSSRFGIGKKMVLMERNALYTLFKNYEEATLAQLLPAVLGLTVKRTGVRSGIARGDFSFNNAAPPSRPLWQEALQRHREGGPKFVIKLGLIALARAIFRRFTPGVPVHISPEAYAGVVAVEDFLDHLPALQARRREIQGRRRRADRDIFPLFRLPLKETVPDTEYVRNHEELIRHFGIDRIFFPAGSEP